LLVSFIELLKLNPMWRYLEN